MRKPKDPTSEICLSGLEGYFEEFLADRLLELNQIRSSLSVKDYFTVKEIAHKWKGIAAPYGFGILGEIANELEVSAQEGRYDESDILIAETEEYLSDKKKRLISESPN